LIVVTINWGLNVVARAAMRRFAASLGGGDAANGVRGRRMAAIGGWPMTSPKRLKDALPAAECPACDPLALYMIRALEAFTLLRAKLLREGLFGRELGTCEVRMALLRMAVLDMAEGRPLTLSRAVRLLRPLGSEKKVRTEAKLMQDIDVFRLEPALDGSRETIVLPTPKLVRYYNNCMPEMLAFVHSVCKGAPET
jgi:hypothetical protein